MAPGDLLRSDGKPILWKNVRHDWENLGFVEPGSVMLLVSTDKADYVLVVCSSGLGYVRHGWVRRVR